MINDNKTQGKWKIQLTIVINFPFSKDSKETLTMHTKSDNTENLIINETDEIIDKLFESFLQKYQNGLKRIDERKQICF